MTKPTMPPHTLIRTVDDLRRALEGADGSLRVDISVALAPSTDGTDRVPGSPADVVVYFENRLLITGSQC